MQYADLQTQYNRIIADATLLAKIATIAIVYYSGLLTTGAILGEIDVLLTGEAISALHVLKSISDVTSFISTYG